MFEIVYITRQKGKPKKYMTTQYRKARFERLLKYRNYAGYEKYPS